MAKQVEKYQRRLRRIFLDQARSRLEASGWSQNQLADFSGISRSHMSELLSGQQAPTIDMLAGLATAFDCAPHELLIPLKSK